MMAIIISKTSPSSARPDRIIWLNWVALNGLHLNDKAAGFWKNKTESGWVGEEEEDVGFQINISEVMSSEAKWGNGWAPFEAQLISAIKSNQIFWKSNTRLKLTQNFSINIFADKLETIVPGILIYRK